MLCLDDKNTEIMQAGCSKLFLKSVQGKKSKEIWPYCGCLWMTESWVAF